jgi:hypothetical protein
MEASKSALQHDRLEKNSERCINETPSDWKPFIKDSEIIPQCLWKRVAFAIAVEVASCVPCWSFDRRKPQERFVCQTREELPDDNRK